MAIRNNSTIDYNLKINQVYSEICDPVFNAFGFTHLIYIRLFQNGRMYLCNDVNWVKKYLECEFYKDFKHEHQAIIPEVKSKYAFWNGYEKDNVFAAVYDYGVWNGLIIYQKDEIFSFGTKKDNTSILNLYVNELDFIEHFILYFKSKARDLIYSREAESSLIINDPSKPVIARDLNQEKYRQFLAETKINKYNFKIKDIDLFLPKKHAQCLFHLSEGKTSKETGNLLNVSSRTVEKYLEILKSQTGCHSSSQLLNLFTKSALGNAISLRFPEEEAQNEAQDKSK